MKPCVKNGRPAFRTPSGNCIYDTIANRKRYNIPLKSYVQKRKRKTLKQGGIPKKTRLVHHSSKTIERKRKPTPKKRTIQERERKRKRDIKTPQNCSEQECIVNPETKRCILKNSRNMKKKHKKIEEIEKSPSIRPTKNVLPKHMFKSLKIVPNDNLTKKILIGKLPVLGCKFVDYLDFRRMNIMNTGASDAKLWFTYLKKQEKDIPIVAKVSLGTVYPYTFLDVERQIYLKVTNLLITGGHCPNLLTAIGEAECRFKNSPDILKLSIQNMKKIIKTADDIFKKCEFEYCDPDILHILLLEKLYKKKSGVKSVQLEDYIENSSLHMNLYFWKNMLFQILYTLRCFQEVGLIHNDLHLFNILVDYRDKPVDIYYQTSKTSYFKITTNYIIKIFDYDRSTKYSTKYNKTVINNDGLNELLLCEDYGQCNYRNDKIDYIKILLLFLDMKLPTEIKNFLVNDVFSNEFINVIINKKYHKKYKLPVSYKLKNNKIKTYRPNNTLVKPIKSLFNTKVFSNLKINKTNIPKGEIVWKFPSLL